MKLNKSLILLGIIALAITGVFISCSEDDASGTPRIRYVRITKPTAADSLLVSAYQDNMVVIVGENLKDARELWFNDQPAPLVPTYITNTNIITIVPGDIPEVISNKITLVFENGTAIEHDFVVDVNDPIITSMKNEYAQAGEVTLIRGNYFYEPVTVTFTGGVVAEVLSVEPTYIEIVVPEGAEKGPIQIASKFGASESALWYKDDRNIFLSSDPFTGWWNADFVVSDPGPLDPTAINGNYIRVKTTVGAWAWMEVAGGPPDAMGDISKNIPDDAIRNPANYYLKFEVNTIKPYNSNVIKLNVGLKNGFDNDRYLWNPPYDTKGQWETVIISLDRVLEGSETDVSDEGYYTRVLFHGDGALDADISFDNFRVIKKSVK